MIRYKILKNLSVIMLGLFISRFSIGQQVTEDSTYNDSIIKRLQVYDSFDVPHDFNQQYRYYLRRAKRVYPLVLEAARVIDSLDQALEDVTKNRKERRMMRKAHQSLKDDFKFLLKDLYVSEGIVLTKLIYRETGMTVTEIISKYKSGMQASLYTGLATFFDQDLDASYKPNTDDFVLECVIQDFKSGKVDFDPNFETMSKEEYKKEKKEYKKRKKRNKKKIKAKGEK